MQGVLFAIFLGTVSAIMLRLGRFTDGYSGPWWVFMLFGMAFGTLGYIVIRWGREAEERQG